MTPATQHLTWYRGDDPPKIVVTVEASGVAVDLTGSTFLCQVRRSRDSSTVLATLTTTVATPASGVVEVEPTAADTELVFGGPGFYDLQWTDSQGVVRSLVAGGITVTGDVSRV